MSGLKSYRLSADCSERVSFTRAQNSAGVVEKCFVMTRSNVSRGTSVKSGAMSGRRNARRLGDGGQQDSRSAVPHEHQVRIRELGRSRGDHIADRRSVLRRLADVRDDDAKAPPAELACDAGPGRWTGKRTVDQREGFGVHCCIVTCTRAGDPMPRPAVHN
jgi:hypothetical protein